MPWKVWGPGSHFKCPESWVLLDEFGSHDPVLSQGVAADVGLPLFQYARRKEYLTFKPSFKTEYC